LRTVGQTIRDAAYRVGQFMKRNVNQSMRNWARALCIRLLILTNGKPFQPDSRSTFPRVRASFTVD
jgi:hypothetical protein